MAHTYTNAVVEKSLDGEQLVVSKIVLYIGQARKKNSIYLYYLGLGTSSCYYLVLQTQRMHQILNNSLKETFFENENCLLLAKIVSLLLYISKCIHCHLPLVNVRCIILHINVSCMVILYKNFIDFNLQNYWFLM